VVKMLRPRTIEDSLQTDIKFGTVQQAR
jgi:hypothetical protein